MIRAMCWESLNSASGWIGLSISPATFDSAYDQGLRAGIT